MSNSSQGSRFDRVLVVLNLLVTAIVGIGIALFLNYKDQQAQIQITELQAQLERENSFAHLVITSGCGDCIGVIEIKNAGNATATNVRIVFEIVGIDPAWKPLFPDLSGLEFNVFPPALDSVVNRRSLEDTSVSTGTPPDAYEIKTSFLPPDQTILVDAEISNDIPIQRQQIGLTAYYYPSGPTIDPNLLNWFLASNFTIAQFTVTATCDNCQGSAPNATVRISALQSQSSFSTTSATDNILAPITIQIAEVVELPSDTPMDQPSPIYLKEVKDSNGVVNLTEMIHPPN